MNRVLELSGIAALAFLLVCCFCFATANATPPPWACKAHHQQQSPRLLGIPCKVPPGHQK